MVSLRVAVLVVRRIHKSHGERGNGRLSFGAAVQLSLKIMTKSKETKYELVYEHRTCDTEGCQKVITHYMKPIDESEWDGEVHCTFHDPRPLPPNLKRRANN